MLVRAAFHLAGAANRPEYRQLLERAEQYIHAAGGLPGLRARYGKDRTFAVPILTNCALAELVDWKEVSPLPFELAAFPQSWYRFFRLPVVSYAIPALVAIGQARYFHGKPRNPVVDAASCAAAIQRPVRARTDAARQRRLPRSDPADQLRRDESRGNRSLPTIPLQNAACNSYSTRPATTEAGRSIPTWHVGHHAGDERPCNLRARQTSASSTALIEWLLSCQHNERHPFTGAAPGGWGWSDLSGACPGCRRHVGCAPGVARFADPARFEPTRPHGPGMIGDTYSAALRGVCWLLNLQNRDGGWPTFCRGWGVLPFDRSDPI